jgi:hypothetical protein
LAEVEARFGAQLEVLRAELASLKSQCSEIEEKQDYVLLLADELRMDLDECKKGVMNTIGRDVSDENNNSASEDNGISEKGSSDE